MTNTITPKILTPTDSLVLHYPQAQQFQDLQQKGFWTANEVQLEKDIQPLLTETTQAEKHAILTVLKLFTLYERRADEFWSTEVRRIFPRPEIQEMAALFGAMELSVHRRVYDRLNKLLYASSDEFYNEYKQNAVMKERMDFLDYYVSSPEVPDVVKIAAFSFAEGVVLFSSFAFLMSFRANGRNLLPNVGAAVKFSAADESLHAKGSCWLFRTLRAEMEELGQNVAKYEPMIYAVANKVREHEYEIIKEIFSAGAIEGITERQMQVFIDSRVDFILSQLGLQPQHNVEVNPVAEWFDKLVGSYSFNDFFATAGSSYSRGWNAEAFVWEAA